MGETCEGSGDLLGSVELGWPCGDTSRISSTASRRIKSMSGERVVLGDKRSDWCILNPPVLIGDIVAIDFRPGAPSDFIFENKLSELPAKGGSTPCSDNSLCFNPSWYNEPLWEDSMEDSLRRSISCCKRAARALRRAFAAAIALITIEDVCAPFKSCHPPLACVGLVLTVSLSPSRLILLREPFATDSMALAACLLDG